MKQLIALVLSLSLLFVGCTPAPTDFPTETAASSPDSTEQTTVPQDLEPHYKSLDDPDFLAHIEDTVYDQTITALGSEDYVVEEVRTAYVSKEYLEELSYNSQSNIYFGYTLSDLDAHFEGKRYIFTLGDDGTTTVQELQSLSGDTTAAMLKNVADGNSVIYICVKIASKTKKTNPVVSIIFTVSAASAELLTVPLSALGAVSTGLLKGVETGDWDEIKQAALFGASKGYKWGAILGALAGSAGESIFLLANRHTGMPMKDIAHMQQESHFPYEVISRINTMTEYQLYKEAGLKAEQVNGQTALIPAIDFRYTKKEEDGASISNLDRMIAGKPPIDPSSNSEYVLCRIRSVSESTLAVLTSDQCKSETSILASVWEKLPTAQNTSNQMTEESFWKSLGNMYANAA